MIKSTIVPIVVLSLLLGSQGAQGFGVIKDLFQKVTHTNNKTEDTVKQSVPICGNGAFSTPNEGSLSPEIIFISNRPSRSMVANSNSRYSNNNNNQRNSNGNNNQGRRRDTSPSSASGTQSNEPVNEVAKEFSFHTENVTIEELERHGFNRDAPVSFLIHGFTSGYPLQAWISAIVEAYTIDRKSSDDSASPSSSYNNGRYNGRDRGSSSGQRLGHNLFIVNWHYAARGILYPRAVANIPIVASYVTRFIDDKLVQQARVDPQRIQLVGHSLGAHLAGFIGKNTKSRLGRIYGLDPAGPCFGTLTGPLYPSSKRLAPSDADEVISIHTNSVLLGIGKPLGRYSVFVEGGEVQPGCKGGGVLASLGTLTFDGGDFDTVACSHSRAPNLMTYRHSQTGSEDDCQMVAYGCKDWQSFSEGQCGVCSQTSGNARQSHNLSKRAFGLGDYIGGNNRQQNNDPLEPVECLLIGLDWQYPGSRGSQESSTAHSQNQGYSNSGGGSGQNYGSQYTNNQDSGSSSSNANNNHDRETHDSRNKRDTNTNSNNQSGNGNENRESTTSASQGNNSRDQVEPISLFMRTADTQPYCAFHYQIVLELNEPFKGRGKPPISIILQDSKSDQKSRRRDSGARQQQNSLSSDEFGNKFNDLVYTHLLTSSKKLKTIDHGTLIFRNGVEGGHRVFKALHINYMSHSNPDVRRRFSSRLCPVASDTDRDGQDSAAAGNRFFFEPCDQQQQNRPSTSSQSSQNHRDNDSNYSNSNNNNGYPNQSSGSQ